MLVWLTQRFVLCIALYLNPHVIIHTSSFDIYLYFTQNRLQRQQIQYGRHIFDTDSLGDLYLMVLLLLSLNLSSTNHVYLLSEIDKNKELQSLYLY
jgi:hypothetical protein